MTEWTCCGTFRLPTTAATKSKRLYPRDTGIRTRQGNEHEEERDAEKRVSLSADRRENQGARRLAGEDARPPAYLGQGGRSRSGRGVEVERGSGVVARRIDLHRRDLQEHCEDDLRQRGGSE